MTRRWATTVLAIEGFVPDGRLCSGGNPSFTGYNGVGNWPLTHLTAGASFTFDYNAWAAHPGWFYLYVTEDGWDPNQPLSWGDIEDQPFLTADHPPRSGSVDGKYTWTGNLLSGKSGRHIIYSVWKRSDSNETFYSCSDVVFDGGNGEVTGVGVVDNPPDENEPPTARAPRRGRSPATGRADSGNATAPTLTCSSP